MGKSESSANKDTVSFLIFSVNDRRFAIDISLVREIVQDTKVHPLPFVPGYIEGVINYSGKPCTVVNPIVLERDGEYSENIDINESTYLVFKRSDDLFSLHISTIEIFYEIQKEDLEDEDWQNSITYKNRHVELFDPDIIESILKRDLGA